MSTRRQRLAELLRQGPMTVEDLAHSVGAPARSVLADLEHVRRGVQPPVRWVVHAAECVSCGFVFERRERLNTPSRCPKCRREDIRDPAFEISSP